MSVPPESVKVGKCYLIEGGAVRRVLSVFDHVMVHYEQRGVRPIGGHWPRAGTLDLDVFAATALREVDCGFEQGSEG